MPKKLYYIDPKTPVDEPFKIQFCNKNINHNI